MGRPRKNPEDLVWEAPPEKSRTPSYDAALAEVKRRPGSWARIRTMSSGSAYSQAGSLRKRLRDERWEVRVAKLETGTEYGLYVRYRTDEQMREER